MTKNITLKTTVHDCTIIKLGGSYAITLPKEKLEKDGFRLGMWVQADLSFNMERDTEDVVFYTEELKKARVYLERFDDLTVDELNCVCKFIEIPEVDTTKDFEQEKQDILIELKAHIKFMENAQKEAEEIVEDGMNQTEDDFDYDKSGNNTVGLHNE